MPRRGSRICPPEEGWEPIDLEQQHDWSKLSLKGRKFGPVRVAACALGNGYPGWTRIEDCSFRHVKAVRSSLHAVVFRNCDFERIHSDFTHTYTTLFLECRLRGRITGINFGIKVTEPFVPVAHLAAYAEEHRRLLSTARYCLDVREAVLENAGFVGEEIAKRVIFAPGQCVIYRAEGLAGRLDRIVKRVLHSPLLHAFATWVRDGERIALGNLHPKMECIRLEEVLNLAHAEGIEVLETSLVSVP